MIHFSGAPTVHHPFGLLGCRTFSASRMLSSNLVHPFVPIDALLVRQRRQVMVSIMIIVILFIIVIPPGFLVLRCAMSLNLLQMSSCTSLFQHLFFCYLLFGYVSSGGPGFVVVARALEFYCLCFCFYCFRGPFFCPVSEVAL